MGEYIIPLLTEARSISNEIFLKAAAASFVQAWKIVDVLMAISSKKEGTISSVDETPPTKEKGKSRDDNEYLTRNQAEDVVYVYSLLTYTRSNSAWSLDTRCLNPTWMNI